MGYCVKYFMEQAMADDNERWVSVSELAEHFGFCKDTIYTWLANKNMPALRAGKLKLKNGLRKAELLMENPQKESRKRKSDES